MAEAKVYLQTVEQRLQAGDLARLKLRVTSSVLVDTDVAAGLIGTAENNQEMDEMGAFNDGDAIAMTTHGRSGLERWVLGSVTERVLGATRLPLLIARPPREATTPEKAGKATKPDESSSSKKNHPCRRVEWQRPIFPQGCPCSIVRAGRLNFRVRDGNGCTPSAIVTNPPACTSGPKILGWR